jgi:hypothetical protein
MAIRYCPVFILDKRVPVTSMPELKKLAEKKGNVKVSFDGEIYQSDLSRLTVARLEKMLKEAKGSIFAYHTNGSKFWYMSKAQIWGLKRDRESEVFHQKLLRSNLKRHNREMLRDLLGN